MQTGGRTALTHEALSADLGPALKAQTTSTQHRSPHAPAEPQQIGTNPLSMLTDGPSFSSPAVERPNTARHIAASPLASTAASTSFRARQFALFALLALLFSVLAGVVAQAQTFRVAGEVTSFSTTLSGAVATAVDRAQNVYVLTSSGNVYEDTFASATNSYTETLLFSTGSTTNTGIAVDSAGANLYIGLGTSVAQYVLGNTPIAAANTFKGFTGPTLPAVDAAGDVYIADSGKLTLYKETLSGTTYTQTSIASSFTGLAFEGIAVDAKSNIFVATNTATNTNVYEVTGTTSYTSTSQTINGTTPGLIQGLAVDASDDLFFQSATELEEATLASANTYNNSPYYAYSGNALSVDSAGNLYLANTTVPTGTKLTVGSGYLNFGSVGPGAPADMTIAFTQTGGNSLTLGTPTVLTQGLQKYDFQPEPSSAGTCAGKTVSVGSTCTVNVQFAPEASGSRLGAIDLNNHNGGKITTAFLGGVGLAPLAVYQSATLISTIACPAPTCTSALDLGRGLTIDPAGNIYVANQAANQILEYPAGSTTPNVLVSSTGGCAPSATALDGEGNVFYTCNSEKNIYELVGGTGTPVAIPVGYTTDDHLSVDAAGNLYTTSYQPGNLFLEVAAGAHTVATIATAPSTARFVGAVTDAAGNTFAPDYNNNILYELPAGSSQLTTLYPPAGYTGTNALVAPHAIAEDPAGDLYVTITVPGSSGVGTSPLLEFTSNNYSATPSSISIYGSDSVAISSDGNIYTVYDNTTLYEYTRGVFALMFPSTAVGQISASQIVTLENAGSAALTISPPTAGTNPSLTGNFSFDPSSSCPRLSSNSTAVTLPIGGTCTDVIEFTPQQAGTNTGSLVTVDNSANVAGSKQTISLTGVATPGAATVTVANASIVLGQNVTLTATITGGGAVPDGVVTFSVPGGPTKTATCTESSSSEVCTFNYPSTALPTGANTITAAFTTDGNYATTSGTGTLTVNPASTTTTVSSSLNPSIFGNSVTFTATVSSAYLTPTGTVSFLDNGTQIGTGTLNSNGVATLMTSALLGGTHPITVSYAATANYSGSTSTTLNQVVNPVTGTNGLASSNQTPTFGTNVTFTDTLSSVNGVTPTGTVTFKNGSTVLGTVTVSGTTVTFSTANLPVSTTANPDKITAVYSGDTNYNTTTSAAVSEVVGKATGYSNALTANPTSSTFGTSVTLTDTLPTLGGVAPTGTVTFVNNGVNIGTGTLTNGVATLTLTSLPAGSDAITATYPGDGNYTSSSSNQLTEPVAKYTPTDVLTTSNPSPAFGNSVTLTATLAPVGSNYPTGSVNFYLNGTTTLLGTGTLTNGVATLATTALPPGADSVTATYGGDANFNTVTSAAITENVAKATGFGDVLSSSSASTTLGTGVTLTDVISPVNGVTPTGTVTFLNNGVSVGTGTLSSNANGTATATLNVSTLPVGADPITASYGGDNTFGTATSNKVTVTVGPATNYSDVLSTSSANLAFGANVTLTDTVAAVNGTYPTGTVTFVSGSTTVGTATFNNMGVATLTTTNLPAGNGQVVIAKFNGDSNFSAENSNSVTENVAKATGYANNLSTSNAAPTFGTSITLTDTIPAVNGVYPTGSVTFYNGSTAIGTGTLSNGVATLTTSSLPAGTDTITAGYLGDTTFSGSTSTSVSEAVAKIPVASNVLASSSTSPAFGASVTFTDTLSPSAGIYPTGTVTFLSNGVSIGTAPISATGVATLATTGLAVGADTITATYPGDTNFNTSTSNTVTENVAKATGYTDTLSTTNASPNFGASVTLTDTIPAVNGITPTGSVTFYNGTTSIGTGTLSGGVATLTTSTLPGGASTITAGYLGDATFGPATSTKVVETVAKATNYGDTLTATTTSPAYGASDTFTDTLAPVNGIYPTGSVTFYSGNAAIGTGVISSTGVATFSTSSLPVGAASITADYLGDTNFAAENSNTLPVTVARASGYTDVLATTNASPSFGASVTFTNTLAPVNGTYPTGTVAFQNNGVTFATANLSGTGVASTTLSTLPVGSYPITAVYQGDGNFSGSTSNSVTETVAKASVPSDTLTTSNATPSFGSSVLLTDTLGALNGVYPTGTVTFSSGSVTLGTGTLSNGVATLTTTALPTGADSVTAVYGGNGNFATATSNAVNETVAKITGTNTLASSNASPMFGTSVTFTATLSNIGGVIPTGTVTFVSNGATLGTVNISSTGTATLATAALPVGSDSVTAVYSGDTNYNTVTSAPDSESVARVSGYTDTLGASPTSASYGQSVSFTDTIPPVNGVVPTGTVTFMNGTTAIGTGTLSGTGVATFTTTTLLPPSETITASYGGDATFNTGTSNPVTVTLGKAAITNGDTATGSGSYAAGNAQVTVTIPYAGSVAPTGQITLADSHGNTLNFAATGCTTISQGNLSCVVTLPTTGDPAGSTPLTVSQAADTNYSGSTGTGTLTLGKAATTNQDKATGSGTYGAASTNVTVTIPYAGTTAPTGAITLTDAFANTVTIQTTGCGAAGGILTCTASLPTQDAAVGTDSVSVSQATDANYNASSGNGSLTIGKAAATSSDTANGTGTYTAATSSIAITIPYAGVASPTGTITVTDAHGNTVNIAASSCTAASNVLSCTANLPSSTVPVGTDALTVTQATDANYNASNGTGTLTIGKATSTNGDTAKGTGTYGSPTTTVAITIPYAGSVAPTGLITLSDNFGNTITVAASSCTAGNGALLCTALLQTANESVGVNPVTVSQAGDANFGASSGTGNITIGKAAASTGNSATGTGTYGASTTPVTVIIMHAGTVAPSGEITVTDSFGNTVSVAASSCTAAGSKVTCTVTLPTSNEPVGANNVTISQAGDANYNGSIGNGTVTINKAPLTSTDTATGTGTYGAATTPVVVTIPFVGNTAPSGAITVTDGYNETVTIAAANCTTSGGALTCIANLPTPSEPVGSNPVTVTQVGDTNYAGSNGTGTVVINAANGSGNDSATGTGSYGAANTPVTVVIPYTGATSPTGGITVADTLGNNVNIAAANCKASGGALVCNASLPTSNEPVGNNTLAVVQAADANHGASTGSGTLTINKAPDTTADTATGSGTYGAASAPVTVTIPYVGLASPTGAITVTDGVGETVTAPASVCSAANHTLTCTVNLPIANESLGANQVVISQAADTNYAGSTGTGTVNITTSVASPVMSTAGGVQNVTITQGTASTLLTATLTWTGAAAPSGAVTFNVDGGTAVPATCLVAASQETCTAYYPTGSLAVGTYVITAMEAADANYAAGTATGNLTVDAGTVSPILDNVSNVSNVLVVYGTASATLTANITYNGPVPTGALTFSVPTGETITATCTTGASPLSCTATYPTAALNVGTYIITATEAADSNYPQGSATALLTVEANASTPVSPILSTGSNVSSVLVPYGTANANLTATIAYTGPAPTGNVTFTVIGGTGLVVTATCSTGASPLTCTAIYPTATLGVGSYRIQLNEAADANYPAGTAIGTLTVTNVAASSSDYVSGTGTYGAPTTQITVAIPYTGSAAPTGAIAVTDALGNTVNIAAASCTSALQTLSCTATLSTANVPAGTDAATVTQAADALYAASTGTGTITIAKAASTSADSATGTGTFGLPTTAVTVTIPYAGAVAPTGAITVWDSLGNKVSVPATSCTAASGTLTCNVTLATANEPLGSNSVLISQAADANYSGSTGAGTVTINKAAAGNNDTATGTGTYAAANTPVTITIPYSGPTPPTGAVTLTDTHGNTVTVAGYTCTATSTTLTCLTSLSTATEPVGANPVTVSQAADVDYAGSTGAGTITINKAGPTNTDTATGTGTYGAPTTTVTVSIPYAGALAPTGAVTITDTYGNTVTVPASSCTAAAGMLNCTVKLPTANEPVGTNALTVTEAADANYSGSTGASNLTITKAPATTTDTATGTGTYGAATTPVTVTIQYAGTAAPTGAITVSDSLGESVNVAAATCTAVKGVLTCTVNLPTANEPVGSNAVTVSQAGDANYTGSTGSGTVAINKAGAGNDTATGNGTYGVATTPVTITIPYTGATPTGLITLTDTHANTVTVLASACTTANETLTCAVILPTATDPVGANAVTVNQAADANHNASTGTGTVTLAKAPATSTDTVIGTATLGAANTTVIVTIPYVGAAAPTGAITVADSLGNTVTVQASVCIALKGLLTCTATLPIAGETLGSNQLTVTQAADGNYSGSTGDGTLTLSKAGATTGDTATGTGTYGSATTPVTVTISFTGTTAPTGAITLSDAHANTVTIAASACTATKTTLTCTAILPTATEPVGANGVTVSEAPDALYSGSTGTGTVTINKAPATATDTATGSSNYGAATTAVTVTIPYAGPAAPTGAITVTDSDGNTVTVPASACTAAKGTLTCTANLPTATVPMGTDTVTISQAADANYSGSTGTGSLSIGKTKPTLTAPTVSPLNAVFGTAVTLTETVPARETGTVTFFNGTTALGTATITNGVATLTTSALPAGTDTLTATANGDGNYSAATSPAVTDTVGSGATSIALTTSAGSINLGGNVTFTATVSTSTTSTIAGTVTFYDGTTALGTATIANGVASMSTVALTVGTHAITATFTPAATSTLSTATSKAVQEIVSQVTASVALTSSLNPAIAGQGITFSATVPTTAAGTVPTGTVTFYDGTTALGTTALNGSGVANFITTTLTGGVHTITAVYSGDNVYGGSTSGAVAQAVSDYSVGNTTPTLSADPGAKAAFNITINPANGVSFTAPVVLTVTGLPANFTDAFAPGTVTPGTAGTTSTMTVQTFAQVAAVLEHKQHMKSYEAAVFWAMLFPLLGLRRVRRRLPKALLMLAITLASFGVMAPLTGCGGGYFGPAPTSYTLTVTGTSGTLQRSTTVTLNVR